MTYLKRFLALALVCAVPLTGCKTSSALSGINTTDNTITNSIEDDLSLLLGAEDSDITSAEGDPSVRYIALGKKQFAGQNYGNSEKYFRKAVELRSDSASAWAGLAASYDLLGKFDFADRAYKQLVDLRGNDARVLNNMGYSYLLRGEYKKARSYFKRAKKADPVLDHPAGNLDLLDKVIRS